VNVQREYAGFWIRCIATFVDALWMSGLVILALPDLKGVEYADLLRDPELWQLRGWQNIVFNHIFPFLIVVSFWVKYAATPGKMLFDCEVVDAETGKKMTVKQSVIRYASYFVSTVSFGLGFLWIVWDERKQGLHDKIAKTVVVIRDDSQIPLEELEKS